MTGSRLKQSLKQNTAIELRLIRIVEMEARIANETFMFRDRYEAFSLVESGHVPAFICDADPRVKKGRSLQYGSCLF